MPTVPNRLYSGWSPEGVEIKIPESEMPGAGSSVGALLILNNLADLDNVVTARNNLGLGGSALAPAGTYLERLSNLSDLSNVATARTNLGLGTSATQPIGAYLQVLNNLSDLDDVATARTNLGLGTSAVEPAGSFLQVANNLSDVQSAATSRTNLGIDLSLYALVGGNLSQFAATTSAQLAALISDEIGTGKLSFQFAPLYQNEVSLDASTYAVGATDTYIRITTTGLTTLTLPDPGPNQSRLLLLHVLTVDTVISAASDVIPLAGGAPGTAILSATAGKWAVLRADGANWQIIMAN